MSGLLPLPIAAGPGARAALPALRAAVTGSGPAVLPYAAGGPAPDACELQQVLQLRFAADHLYRQAMQLLRDAPL